MYQNNYLLKHLRSASLGHDDHDFLRAADSTKLLSYRSFFQNVEKMASALVALGVQPDDRVAVQASKTPEMLELYLATAMVGAIFLPLNTGYTATEISYFLTDATPHVFVCDPGKYEQLQPVAVRCGVKKVISLGADGAGTLTVMRDAEKAGFKAIYRGADDLAAILYTSGTTGRSKGAMLSHGALVSNAKTLMEYWKFSEQDVLIHALPIFHTHGLFVATNIALFAGCSCIFMQGFDAAAICEAMPMATVLMGVPTFYTRLLTQPELPEASKDMRLFISGSAPLLAETHIAWQEKTGHAVLERYGMTETNMNTSNPYVGERRAGTVGFPLPGVEITVTDAETGSLLPTGEIGILEIRGPNLFKGYWQMPDKTAEELQPSGFFITGDLGKIDSDGYVHIIGRSKDLVITGGYNVYPKEVELLIDAIDGVNESAVIGLPHKDFGEAVVAVIATKSKKLAEGDIFDALSDQLARFKQPKAVIFVDSLLRNTMGKVQKNSLRTEYATLFDGA